MRSLIAIVLYVPILAFIYAIIVVGVAYHDGELRAAPAGSVAGVAVFFILVIRYVQSKLWRKSPQLLNARMPKQKEKTGTDRPPEAVERLFADVPIVTHVKAKNRSVEAAMPPHMKKFIDAGMQAIQKTQR